MSLSHVPRKYLFKYHEYTYTYIQMHLYMYFRCTHGKLFVLKFSRDLKLRVSVYYIAQAAAELPEVYFPKSSGAFVLPG